MVIMHFVVILIVLGSSSLWGSSSSLSSICYNTAMSDSEASTRPPSTVGDFTVLEHLTTLEADTLEPLPLDPPADPETLLPLSDHRRKFLMEPQKKVADGKIGAMTTKASTRPPSTVGDFIVLEDLTTLEAGRLVVLGRCMKVYLRY